MSVNRSLLLRYLSGECTDDEKEQVSAWVTEDPENLRLLREWELLWEASENPLEAIEYTFNAQADWNSLWERIEHADRDATTGKLSKDSAAEYKSGLHPASAEMKDVSGEIRSLEQPLKTSRNQRFDKRNRFSQLLRTAAVLLIASLASLLAWQNFYVTVPDPDESGPVMREVVTEKGQRSSMVLSDGTNMTINADSRLLVPEIYHADKRDVFLEKGEAFFNVAKDPARPFLIHMEGAVIEVLGTSFSVRSYPEENNVRVVVKEGIVSMSALGNDSESAVMTENQIGRFNILNHTLTSADVEDMELFLSWTDGYLKFSEAALKDVALELERRYNVTINFEDPKHKELHLSAELKSRSIYNVLNVISAALEISYHETGQSTFLLTAAEGSEQDATVSHLQTQYRNNHPISP